MARPALIQDRVAAVERLVKLFRLERFVYLTVTAVSFCVLIAIAIRMFLRGTAPIAEWGLLFGSSGLITVTANRVLQMWNQSLRMVAAEPIESGRKEDNNE